MTPEFVMVVLGNLAEKAITESWDSNSLRKSDILIFLFIVKHLKYEKEEGKNVARVMQKTIRERFKMAACSVSSAITRLEKSGFLEKRKDGWGLYYLISKSLLFTGEKPKKKPVNQGNDYLRAVDPSELEIVGQ